MCGVEEAGRGSVVAVVAPCMIVALADRLLARRLLGRDITTRLIAGGIDRLDLEQEAHVAAPVRQDVEEIVRREPGVVDTPHLVLIAPIGPALALSACARSIERVV